MHKSSGTSVGSLAEFSSEVIHLGGSLQEFPAKTFKTESELLGNFQGCLKQVEIICFNEIEIKLSNGITLFFSLSQITISSDSLHFEVFEPLKSEEDDNDDDDGDEKHNYNFSDEKHHHELTHNLHEYDDVNPSPRFEARAFRSKVFQSFGHLAINRCEPKPKGCLNFLSTRQGVTIIPNHSPGGDASLSFSFSTVDRFAVLTVLLLRHVDDDPDDDDDDDKLEMHFSNYYQQNQEVDDDEDDDEDDRHEQGFLALEIVDGKEFVRFFINNL